MNIAKLIDNILELPGIEGLCLIGEDGRLHLNRLPAYLDDELLTSASITLAALYGEADSVLPGGDDILLRYEEHWLMLRRGPGFVLVLLARHDASQASARMVTNIALRHLDAATLATLEDAPRAAAAPSTAAAGAAPRPQRMYRGQAY